MFYCVVAVVAEIRCKPAAGQPLFLPWNTARRQLCRAFFLPVVIVSLRSSAVIFASSASKQGGSAKAVDYEGTARHTYWSVGCNGSLIDGVGVIALPPN